MRRIFSTIFLSATLIVVLQAGAFACNSCTEEDPARLLRARVKTIVDSQETVPRALVEIMEGSRARQEFVASFSSTYIGLIGEGDEVLVRLGSGGSARIVEPVRSHVLGLLVALFCIVILLTMRADGLRVLFSFLLAGVLLFYVFLPMSYRGWPPMLLAAVTGLPICAGGILIICGWNRKSLYAIIGSLSAIFLAVWLPVALARLLSYTGLENDFGTFAHLDVVFWYSDAVAKVDFYQLLLAGAVIAAIGATMDVSINISTAINEVSLISPNASRLHLWRTGVAIGKDVFATMAVAVVLIFIGYQFETITLYHVRSVTAASGQVSVPYSPMLLLNYEEIGAELVHILSTMTALGLAVPLTAAAAAFIKIPPVDSTGVES